MAEELFHFLYIIYKDEQFLCHDYVSSLRSFSLQVPQEVLDATDSVTPSPIQVLPGAQLSDALTAASMKHP